MFGFRRHRKNSATTVASFVKQTLEQARRYALDNNIQVGQEFKYRIENIPAGISSPHEISLGLMNQAIEYGLTASAIIDERVSFMRLV